MKRLFIFFALAVFCGAGIAAGKFDSIPSSVQWERYSDALNSARQDNKLIFVDIVADWCLPCREMDKTTYRDETVVRLLNSKFHPVRLNQASQDSISCDGKTLPAERCFFDVWNLMAVPSYVLIAPKGISILTYSNSLDAIQMKLLLLQFLEKEKEWRNQ